MASIKTEAREGIFDEINVLILINFAVTKPHCQEAELKESIFGIHVSQLLPVYVALTPAVIQAT